MKKIFAFLCLVPSLAMSATTFSQDTTYTPDFVRAAVITCTTGSESAPSGATAGLDLQGVKGVAVFAEAAGNMTAGGKLLAYLYNPVTSRWTAAPDLDITVSAVQYQAFAGLQVVSDFARLAYVPSGVGQAVTIYLVARRLPLSLR